jgi:hypothetical protein
VAPPRRFALGNSGAAHYEKADIGRGKSRQKPIESAGNDDKKRQKPTL